MSPVFIKHFKKANKCLSCPRERQIIKGKIYSLCPEHLEKAKVGFRVWSKERKLIGRCISCNRKSLKNQLRCKYHSLENLERCRDWMTKHPEWAHNQWNNQKTQYLDKGFCVCPSHNKLPKNRKRCDQCNARNRLYKKARKDKT